MLEAVRVGLVPRVTRRLTGHERSLIRAGTVWVWEEGECNCVEPWLIVQRRPTCAGGRTGGGGALQE